MRSSLKFQFFFVKCEPLSFVDGIDVLSQQA